MFYLTWTKVISRSPLIGINFLNGLDLFNAFQIQYNIIVRTGRRTYPRYFRVEFAFNRAKYKAQPRVVDLAKIELRSKGWSFPAITKHLDISVGIAWNMSKHSG